MKTPMRLFLLLSVMASPLVAQRLIEQSIFTDTLCVGKGCGQSFCALPAYDTSKELLICDETEIAGWINGTEGLYLYSSAVTVSAIIETASASGIPVLRFINGEPQIWNLGMDPTEKFRLGDGTALTNPVTVEAGSPDDSIYVDSTGAVGFGTATPTHQIDVYSATDPSVYMNVESGASTSVTATIYTTDVAQWIFGPYTPGRIGAYDNTNSKAPFSVEINSPTDSLFVDSTGDVGMGTASPSASLHVSRSLTGATDNLLRLQNTALSGSGSARFLLRNDQISATSTADPDWTFNSNGSLRISAGIDAAEFIIDAAGALKILGSFTFAEISTPSATTNFGTLWAETDDDLHYYDGAGVEHVLTAAYGGLYATNNATVTTVSVTNTWYQVTIFTETEPSRGTTPSAASDDITVGSAGDWDITAAVTVDSSGGSGSQLSLEVQINNGASSIPGCHISRTMTGGGGESGAVPLSCIAALSTSDTVELWIRNETNTDDYVVQDVSLKVKRLDL